MRKMTHAEIKQADPDYTAPLCDPQEWQNDYISVLKVLNDPVKDVSTHLDEVGLRALSPDALVQMHFTAMLECSVMEYRYQIGIWICD